MAATRRQPQHLIALGIANHHRLARAGLRADVADAGAQHDAPARARTSAHALAAILEAPPACVLGARLDGVLRWAHGIGPVRHANVPCTRSAGSTRTPTSTGRR